MKEKEKERKFLGNKELLEQIAKEITCNEILGKFKVRKPELQMRVKDLMVREKRFIEVQGLFPALDEVEFTGRGIMIRNNRLED